MSDPFVLVGLARSRAAWFSELSRWSSSGSAPVELVRCLTSAEARAVLGSGRQVSALLVDAGAREVDRELIATAAEARAVTFVVDDARVRRDWDSLGCAAVVGDQVTGDELLALLEQHARRVPRDVRRPVHVDLGPEAPRSFVIGVTGGGGEGSSTIAMALAQALATDRPPGSVALVDGCRQGDLAMYHDVGDVIPGLPELVEAHRIDHPDPAAVRDLLFDIGPRGYDLLLGMRSTRDWVAMRAPSLTAAIDGLERSYEVVVVDHDPDLEGEDATGSLGVEDRHGLARTVTRRADLVLAVGSAQVKGMHGLLRLLASIRAEGVPAGRVLPVVNRCPRSPATRAGVTRALAELTGDGEPAPPPVFVPRARRLTGAHHPGGRVPYALANPLGRATRRSLLRLGSRQRATVSGVPIRPGELGVLPDVERTPYGQSDVA